MVSSLTGQVDEPGHALFRPQHQYLVPIFVGHDCSFHLDMYTTSPEETTVYKSYKSLECDESRETGCRAEAKLGSSTSQPAAAQQVMVAIAQVV